MEVCVDYRYVFDSSNRYNISRGKELVHWLDNSPEEWGSLLVVVEVLNGGGGSYDEMFNGNNNRWHILCEELVHWLDNSPKECKLLLVELGTFCGEGYGEVFNNTALSVNRVTLHMRGRT